MAHQAHNISWDALTSCLKVYSPQTPIKEKPVNLYFRFEDNQDKNISHFVSSFVNNIKEHTACERKKYPATFDIPDKDELLLGDEITQKITPLVRKWRDTYQWDLAAGPRDKKEPKASLQRLCTHDQEGFECGCVVPLQERKAAAFLRQHYPNDCYEFFKKNTEAFYNIEVVKTLILYGEMEPILRVCGHPEVGFARWQCQNQCYDTDADAGWDTVYETALDAYLSLNILYSFPSLWDPTSTSGRRTDYRSTKLYQKMLRRCTWSFCTSEVAKYPHRAFFGIGDHQFRSWPDIDPNFSMKYLSAEDRKKWSRVEFPYGQAPIEEFLVSEKRHTDYLPDISAVVSVRNVLYSNSLPIELVDDVMDKADYTVKRRLVYADDPLHAGNGEELQKYLKFCWRVMVNSNMMADALGVEIGWEMLIYRCLSSLISSPGGIKISMPDVED